MITHMNVSMMNLLKKEGIEDFNSIKRRLPNQLVRKLKKGIRVIGGCYLINISSPKIDVSKYNDLTDAECSINHIHIEEYTRNQKTGALMRVAIQYMLGLKDLLVTQFPSENFHIVLGYDSGANSPTVRFYKLRDNERSWVNLKRLENYEDAVLIFEL